MDYTLQHLVRYWSHRRFFPEPFDVPVDPETKPEDVRCPDPYFCFEFVDRTTVEFEWPDGSDGAASKLASVSPMYYPGGRVVTREEMIAEYPEEETLRFNLRDTETLMRDRNGRPRDSDPIEEHIAIPETNRLDCYCGARLAFVEAYEFGREPSTVFKFQCSCGHRVNYPQWPADAEGEAP